MSTDRDDRTRWADFLTARLGDTEEWTLHADCPCPDDLHRPDCGDFVLGWTEELRKVHEDHYDQSGYCHRCGSTYEEYPCPTIRSLAAIWWDHPDFPGRPAVETTVDTPGATP